MPRCIFLFNLFIQTIRSSRALTHCFWYWKRAQSPAHQSSKLFKLPQDLCEYGIIEIFFDEAPNSWRIFFPHLYSYGMIVEESKSTVHHWVNLIHHEPPKYMKSYEILNLTSSSEDFHYWLLNCKYLFGGDSFTRSMMLSFTRWFLRNAQDHHPNSGLLRSTHTWGMIPLSGAVISRIATVSKKSNKSARMYKNKSKYWD